MCLGIEESANIYGKRGIAIAEHEKNYAKAIKDLEKAVNLNPPNRDELVQKLESVWAKLQTQSSK